VRYFIKVLTPSADKQTKVNYMQKCLIFILMFFSLAVQARANWNPYVMDHERFVHLSEQDKRAVIISTMELMVELESKYQKEVKTSGYTQEKYKKFVEAITKLSNFVLSSAIAAHGDKDLQALANEFSVLVKNLGKEDCIYGGYVSKMATSNGVKYCRHPSSLKDSVPKEAAFKKAYLSNGGACNGPNKISCNPVIFGYKPADKTPFCVETGYLKSGKAHNVSYDCMREALKVGEDKKSGVTVLQAAMSEFKVEKDKSNPFNDIHSFIFETCACGSTSIDQDYARYIKPHRTCFGMMNTLRTVQNNDCQVIDTVDPTDFADKWAQYFGKADAFKVLKPERSGDFDQEYKSIIDHSAVKAICDARKPANPVKPVPGTKDEKKWVCETECKEVADIAKPEVKKIVCTVTKSGWDIIKAGVTSFDKVELAESEIILAPPDTKEVKVKMKDSALPEQVCKTNFKPSANGPTCSIAVADVAGDKTKSTATVSFQNAKDGDVTDILWDGKAASDPKKPEENVVAKTTEVTQVKVSFKIKGAPPVNGSTLSCPGEVPKLVAEDPSKENYDIKAKTDTVKPKDLNATVNATIQKKGEKEDIKLPEGHHISWYREGAKKAPDAAKEASTRAADSVPEGEAATPPEVATDAVVEAAPEIGTGPSTSQPREKVAYKVCAQLIEDASKKPVAGPACDTIPALKEEAAKPAYTPGQNAPPPQFIMPVNNTRQMGIL
jgi:hypothetical protein